MNFDGIRRDVLFRIGNGLLHPFLGDDLAGAPYQAFEQQPFACGQLDLGVVNAEPFAVQINA